MKAQDAVKVIEKVKIEGTLTLQSPLLIGAGKMADQGHDVDTYVLRGQGDKPLIPGTSLAGVLRSYVMGINPSVGKNLFGYIEDKHEGEKQAECQSAIVIDDILLEDAAIVHRDGVGIDSYTHTAIKGKKYDYEAVERGAHGQFEAVITLRGVHQEQMDEIQKQIKNLVVHLQKGFMVGALTTKGFGHVQVTDATAEFYDFTNKEDVEAWLKNTVASTIWQGEEGVHELHNAQTFYVDADFALRSSLIIRDYDTDEAIGENKISAVQKMSNDEYVIPGTSLKGVLRHQAERIFQLTGKSEVNQMKLKELMGYADDKKDEEGKQHKQKSNFYVDEVYMKKGIIEKEQSRNRIDRFTGGTIESALFTTKPIWQEERNEPTVHIHYEIHKCEDWQAGLALFLLRDLWKGDVAVGGEKAIGRGTLQGIAANIEFNGKMYVMGNNGNVASGDWHELEQYAQAFVAE
jgi:CRISPR/Cas system CSM-associated protein Csm3 (group 7 of RAMP superfamily)